MKELIDSVISRLNSEATTVKYSDVDWGQLDLAQPPVKWPCALISIYSGNYSNIGIDRTQTPRNRQSGEFIIEIRIANLQLTNSSGKAPALQRDQAFTIFDCIKEVHELIHGWTPGNNIGLFIRSRITSEKRDDGIQEYVLQYTVGISDC